MLGKNVEVKSEQASSVLSTDNSGKHSLSIRTQLQDALAEYDSVGNNSFCQNDYEFINLEAD